MVGAALKDVRKKIVLSTKTPAKTPDAMATLETSLKELGTDYVDIWYLHSREKPEDIPDELFDAQDEAVKQGKMRFRASASTAATRS
jgi:aryl-alcohol dehydrogenase-like predicted oxidoreductase